MIEIVISVCLIQNPADCKDVNLNFMAERVTMRQCMLFGQSEIAKWVNVHPKWRVQRWRCGVAKQVAKA